MKDKKLYEIIKAICKVWRASGIIEYDDFTFLKRKTFCIDEIHLITLLEKQIDMFNEFCPEHYIISKYDDAEFEKVGELWL